MSHQEVLAMDALASAPGNFHDWFLSRLLETRRTRERHEVLEGDDAAALVYLAGLLAHLVCSPWLLDLDRHGPRLDIDVADATGKERSPRDRLEVLRCAADRYLLYLGLWDGLQGNQQGRYYQVTEGNLADRACRYYSVSADLAERFPAPVHRLVPVLRELSCHLGSYLALLLALRGDVLGLFPVVSGGQEFHLARGTCWEAVSATSELPRRAPGPQERDPR
jgi:hypothetical protein